MGRIKSKLIKRTGKSLLGEVNNFTDNFNENKEVLMGLFPSKKIRNQIAGYITRKLKVKSSQKFRITKI